MYVKKEVSLFQGVHQTWSLKVYNMRYEVDYNETLIWSNNTTELLSCQQI